jgi:anion-transporting  ArsA/GET3 family ATPase
MNTDERDMDRLLDERHIIVCTGAGGVGKTTTSAALALRAADRGRRAIVCTIDPARRLAQSMGLEDLSNEPKLVAARVRSPRGELHAMMLDMKRTFDDMVLEMTTRERAEQIFANPFYRHVSSTLAGTQEYMAMEKLWELHELGRWELIVIDTPPTRSALDFLDAPKRLTDFLQGRFLRLMLWPSMKAGAGGLKVLNMGMNVALRAVTKITGSELLGDVAAFFQAFEGMYEHFKHRSMRVRELLQGRHTAFIVVSAPTGPSLREARYFADRLRDESMPLGGVLVNRSHELAEVRGLEDARAMASRIDSQPLADALAAYADRQVLAAREDRLVGATLGPLQDVPVWRVPELDDEVTDLRSLREVGELVASASAR